MAANNDFSNYNPASFFSFLSGARLGQIPAQYQVYKTRTPSSPPSSDQIALIATALGGVGVEHFEYAIRGLLGARDIERSFGLKDRLLQMNFDYLVRTRGDVAEAETILRDLGLTDQTKFSSRFEKWFKDYQVEQNENRFWRNKPLLDGFGNRKDLGPVGNALHPIEALQTIAGRELQHQATSAVERLTNSSREYTDISALTKAEQTRFIDHFLRTESFKKIGWIESQLADTTISPARRARLEADHTRWTNYMRQYADDNFIPNEKAQNRISPISRMSYSFKQQVIDQGQVLQTMRKLNRNYSRWAKWASEISRDPAMFIIKAPFRLLWYYYLRYALYRPIRKIWDNFVRGTLKEIPIVGKYLSNAAKGIYFSKGTRGLARGLTYRGANLVGRAGIAVTKALASAAWKGVQAVGKFIIASVARTLAAAAALAIGPEAMAAIIIAFIIGLFILVLVILLPFMSFQGFIQPASACQLPSNIEGVKSTALVNSIYAIASHTCTPPPMILSIMRLEFPSTLQYNDDQVNSIWYVADWNNASQQLKDMASCSDTCDRLPCAPGAHVYGPLQFEVSTFNGYASKVQPIVGHTPNPCNLQDSIVAASFKIKADSGTSSSNCSNWDQNAVMQVEGNYCGNHCQSSSSCSLNNCQTAWQYYQGYQSATGSCSAVGNNDLVTAIMNLRGSYGETDCLLMVNKALTSIDPPYKGIYTEYASQAFVAASALGYKTIPASSHVTPAPGDIVSWSGGLVDEITGIREGHVGVVVQVTAQYVYVYDNLSRLHNGNRPTPYVLNGDNLDVAGAYGVGSRNTSPFIYDGIIEPTNAARK